MKNLREIVKEKILILDLLRDNRNHRMVSRPGELPFANYRKIDNAHLVCCRYRRADQGAV